MSIPLYSCRPHSIPVHPTLFVSIPWVLFLSISHYCVHPYYCFQSTIFMSIPFYSCSSHNILATQFMFIPFCSCPSHSLISTPHYSYPSPLFLSILLYFFYPKLFLYHSFYSCPSHSIPGHPTRVLLNSFYSCLIYIIPDHTAPSFWLSLLLSIRRVSLETSCYYEEYV